MGQQQIVGCRCGKVSLRVGGPHIASTECLCNSCRNAGEVLSALPGAPRIVDDKGATPFVMHRKDRVGIARGQEHLKEYRLSPDAGTRRVVASCCSTPVFLEFENGHWLSIYGLLWPEGTLPPIEMRTMVGDLEDPAALPDDIPNLSQHSLRFYARLFGAWVKMGFRSPKFQIEGKLDV